jgi:HK97 family phage portal protein
MAQRPKLTAWVYDGQSLHDAEQATKSANEAALDLLKMAGVQVENLDSVTANQVYRVVSWVFRCVRLRADALSGLPFTITTGANDPANWPLQSKLPRLLWLSESSLCLNGAAYWFRHTALDLRTLLALKWLAASTITPELDSVVGLTGFTRRTRTGPILWKPEQVVHLWLPDPDVEVGPGLAPAQAALIAASVSMNVDLYASAYFKRGAINPVIISLIGGTGTDEVTRVENWFKKIATGIRSAFRAIAVNNDVKITQLGSPVNELAMPELDKTTKEKICAAFGIHPSMLAESANFATAQETRLSFYQDTIIPEATWIEQELNDQLFLPLGLRLTFHPETMDIMQTEETERATAFESYVRGGLPIPWAAEMLGLEAPQGHTWDELDKEAEPAPVTPETIAETTPQLLLPSGNAKALQDDLRKWQRKAEKRGKACDFDSDAIPAGIKSLVTERMERNAATAFDFLKAIDEAAFTEAEAALQKALGDAFDAQLKIAVAAIAAGEAWNAAAFAKAVIDSIDDVLVSIALGQALREAVTVGIDFDPAVINSAAWNWARTFTNEYMVKLSDATQKVVRDAVAKFVSTPGMTNADLRALLEPAFGTVRAQLWATTETTRAFSMGTNLYQRELADMGVDFERIWSTSNDEEKVCVVCAPLNGKPEDVWAGEFPDGPPAHPRCRCHPTLRLRRKKASA